jgi:TolB protein
VKIKYWIPILLIIFIFSFTTCTTPKTATETTAPEATTKSKIAFMSDRDGNGEIYIMNIDGSEQVRLTNNRADDISPSFSPIP